MARLPARLKHLYYPTPTSVIDMVASYLAPAQKDMIWLDPTAGEGLALAGLARRVGNAPTLHGVEVDVLRAKASEGNLNEIVQTDVNAVTFPRNGYDLAWFNPPYDYNRIKTDEMKHDKRESQTIFRHLFVHPNNILVPGSIFIGILAYTDIQFLAHDIWRHFQGPHDDSPEGRSYPLIFQFPNPEYEEFGQYVIIGRKRKPVLAGLPKEVEEAVLEGIEHETHPRLGYAPSPLFHVPGVPTAQQGHMRTKIYKPSHGAQVALKHGWFARPQFTERYWRKDKPPTRPVLPLQNSHLAQLLSSGALQSGVIFDTTPEGGQKYMLRGRTIRVTQRVSEEFDADGNLKKWVERETYVTEILLIDEEGHAQLLKVADASEESEGLETGAIIKPLTPPSRVIDTPYNDMNNRMV